MKELNQEWRRKLVIQMQRSPIELSSGWVIRPDKRAPKRPLTHTTSRMMPVGEGPRLLGMQKTISHLYGHGRQGRSRAAGAARTDQEGHSCHRQSRLHRTVPACASPAGGLMSQQFSSRYPADVVEHGKFGTHLALLMPPLAALLYPFLLEAFHANISPVIRGQSAEPALRSAVAASLFTVGLHRAYRGAARRDEARRVSRA